MAQKRPFDDEVVDEGSSKHQKQGLYSDSFPFEDSSGSFYDIGESSIGKRELGFHEKLENSSCRVAPREVVEDVETDMPKSASVSHWATRPSSSSTDEDELQEGISQLPLYHGYFGFDHPVRPFVNREDVYYCLLDYPPRKRVSMGPDHQADIPSWRPQENGTTSDDLGTNEPAYSDSNSGGIHIMPIPENKSLPDNDEKPGCGRVECTCPDQESMRCVRQHIAEARDKLRKTLGPYTFMELGFYDMGEEVANNWGEEEEQLFHEVVYSNPVSLGKNFWNVLYDVFSSRTKMEIVSYYFNVFMLRKRAEQNRCVPMNIDSDNDEWQGSGEGDMSEEDEDSGIESPIRHDVPEFYQNVLRFHEDEHEFADELEMSEEAQDYIGKKSDLVSVFEASGKKSDDDDVENDVQDGSCTSSDSGAPIQGPRLKSDDHHVWNDYIIDSSDAKMWDVFSLSCPKQSVEFLPTCSMIEEVFGDGDFDSKSKRW